MRILFTRTMISSFVIGIVVGSFVTLAVLGLMTRLLTRDPSSVPPASQSGPPAVTITLPQDTLQYLIDDALADVSIPLVTLRDPYVQLEPDALMVLRLRGDTALLGGQTIVLRMRIVALDGRLGVVTESADIGGRINVTGTLTQQLDEQINAVLAERFALGDQLVVTSVGGTTDEITIEAHLREQS